MEVHFLILLLVLVINFLPIKDRAKKKFCLPLSFFILLLYWAFRYEYGQDYWAYYDYFYSNMQSDKGFGEVLFFNVFFPMFKYYYQAVIAQSLYVLLTIFYMVRTYVPEKYYWLFFILFMCVPGFHFSLISAMRSSMAAATMFWGYSLFYIKKKNLLLYASMVIVATLFHTSAIVFLVVPIVDLFFSRVNGRTIFISFIVFLLLAMSIGGRLFTTITAGGDENFLGSYSHLSDGFGDSNILGTIHKGIILIPTYYLCVYYNKLRDVHLKRIFILAFIFISIRLLNLDFNGRFTAYLFLFFIVAFCYTLMNLQKGERVIMIIPYFMVVLFDLYIFYSGLIVNAGNYLEGNFFKYKTIFEASPLP